MTLSNSIYDLIKYLLYFYQLSKTDYYLSITTVVCPTLTAPANGMFVMSGNYEGATANFSCEPGYDLKGEALLTCVNGQWNSTTPVCEITGMRYIITELIRDHSCRSLV